MAEREVKVAFQGGGREVGRSAIWIRGSGGSFLLDYGVSLEGYEPQFPLHVPPRDIDAVVLTHAHLDHAGAVPLLYVSLAKPLYASQLTAETLELLLRDFMKLSSYYIPYERIDVEKMFRYVHAVKPGDQAKVKEAWISFYSAGHIPGSLQVLIEMNGKKILYTGDVNTTESKLLKSADLVDEDLDAVIIEATYAGINHPERVGLEKELVRSAIDTLENGGKVLIPAFSVGRAQEMLCVLASHNVELPIFLDGMARTVSQVFLNYPQFFKDYDLLKRALSNVHWVKGERDRKRALRKPSVIVTPAGMLKGGPAVEYVKRLMSDPKNSIYLVSYQIQGTPGRTLLETGKFDLGGEARRVEATVKWFDFSSHAGDDGLWGILRRLNGSPKVFVVHGESKACVELAERVERELGLEAHAPKVGEAYYL